MLLYLTTSLRSVPKVQIYINDSKYISRIVKHLIYLLPWLMD